MENFIFCAVFVNTHRCQKFTGRRAETSENIWTSKDFLTNDLVILCNESANFFPKYYPDLYYFNIITNRKLKRNLHLNWAENQFYLQAKPKGTYWYHSHVGAHRTNGVFGAFVIKEKYQRNVNPPTDVIMQVGDWHYVSSEEVSGDFFLLESKLLLIVTEVQLI